ncbi:hypothetical protein POMI540_0135 [Schizosaccharomyces pombe]|uniref:UPF0357 protein C1687.07 n=1 Tax=Schizosaccharomyces pombe (strain 972 / ATCC 24843) TaxID=284812 RepID=YFF7_SCHPO|nr:uncharacterized protein SPAC1687.07 [Schizosaccharomyces pombe]O14068.1 RecName: Full=UPF0357 protein C1687.07; Flags: Precursor [Schizosaccharomyces pombe 972h-]CAA22601.1 conserved fungal protein [Schizosaccharomyces pombe]|eukprot:NP_593125.1 uncharacterized protein SPAC1687.07 [Schizosaccharomyces pombe]
MASFHIIVSYVTVVLAIIIAITFAARRFWISRYRSIRYSPVENSFEADFNNGLNSSSFDIAQNILAQDTRAGLDEAATSQIRGLMKQLQCSFDQARLIYIRKVMSDNNVDSTGMPLDNKAVTKL